MLFELFVNNYEVEYFAQNEDFRFLVKNQAVSVGVSFPRAVIQKCWEPCVPPSGWQESQACFPYLLGDHQLWCCFSFSSWAISGIELVNSGSCKVFCSSTNVPLLSLACRHVSGSEWWTGASRPWGLFLLVLWRVRTQRRSSALFCMPPSAASLGSISWVWFQVFWEGEACVACLSFGQEERTLHLGGCVLPRMSSLLAGGMPVLHSQVSPALPRVRLCASVSEEQMVFLPQMKLPGGLCLSSSFLQIWPHERWRDVIRFYSSYVFSHYGFPLFNSILLYSGM